MAQNNFRLQTILEFNEILFIILGVFYFRCYVTRCILFSFICSCFSKFLAVFSYKKKRRIKKNPRNGYLLCDARLHRADMPRSETCTHSTSRDRRCQSTSSSCPCQMAYCSWDKCRWKSLVREVYE